MNSKELLESYSQFVWGIPADEAYPGPPGNAMIDFLEFALKQKVDDFTEAARPLIKYLCENHHPHVSAIVTPTDAQLFEGIKSTGEIMDYVKD